VSNSPALTVQTKLSAIDDNGVTRIDLRLTGGMGLNIPRIELTRSGTRTFEARISSQVYTMIRSKTTSIFGFCDQFAEFTVHKSNSASYNLICPINRTSRFRMTMYKAFIYQNMERERIVLMRPGTRNYNNHSDVLPLSVTSKTWYVETASRPTGSVVPQLDMRVVIGKCTNLQAPLNRAVSIRDVLIVNQHHIVTFDSRGGATVSSKIVAAGSDVGTLPALTRIGHIFDGWYTAESGGTKISSTTKVTRDVTYYAQWVAGQRFLPNPDGFCFINSGSSFGYPSGYRIPLERFIEVFENIITARFYYDIYGPWGGSCFGFAVASTQFNQKYIRQEAYSPGAITTFSLPVPRNSNHRVTQLLERYQISWYKGYERIHNDIKRLVDTINEFQRTGIDPVVLNIWKSGGHAIVAYKVEEDAQRYTVHLYDNWYIGETTYLYIPKNGGVRDITISKGWSGANNPTSIDFIKASKIKERYLDKMGATGNGAGMVISVNGNAEITNSSGVSLLDIEGTEEIVAAPGSELISKAYKVPEDKYVIKPLCEKDKSLIVSMADDEKYLLLEVPHEISKIWVSLGDVPSIELSGVDNLESEVNVDFMTTSSDFTEESAVVKEMSDSYVIEFIPQGKRGDRARRSIHGSPVSSKAKCSKNKHGATELKVSFKAKRRK